jgi:hypothetical protein
MLAISDELDLHSRHRDIDIRAVVALHHAARPPRARGARIAPLPPQEVDAKRGRELEEIEYTCARWTLAFRLHRAAP